MREIMLILHFIGLAMGLGTSFAHLFLNIAASKTEAVEARKLNLHAFALNRMGHIGLTLLIVTGGYLMTPYWGTLMSTPTLMAKLLLVLVLAALVGMISAKARKAKQGDADAHLRKIEPLGNISMLVALIIVILAVYTFH